MNTQIDLTPAAECVADLVIGVRDEQLTSPTPCADMTVADLLDHLTGVALGFTGAAVKDPATGAVARSADGSRLGNDWRTRIANGVAGLPKAWQGDDAWTGMTAVGGVHLPGELAGMIALNELVLHGWDLARATGQEPAYDEGTVAASHAFTLAKYGPGHEEDRKGLFGPAVPVPEEAPILDRLVGLAGRHPEWPEVP